MSKAPPHFPVTVLMEVRPVHGSRWITQSWAAVGVVVGERGSTGWRQARESDESGVRELLFAGLHVRLHADECESYYHNLLSETPKLFVIAREDAVSGRPQPFQVTASFDEAHAYLEAEESVYEVPVPPEIYRAVEAFVLEHYVPEPRKNASAGIGIRGRIDEPPQVISDSC